MDYEFVDLASKAKELAISEAILRSRVLSEKLFCFVFISNQTARGTQESFLPAWSGEEFPLCDWVDYGSPWKSDGKYHALTKAGGRYFDGEPMAHSHPEYLVTGWVALDPFAAREVLTKKHAVDLQDHWVWVFGQLPDTSKGAIPLCLRGQSEWIKEGDSGYDEIRGPRIEPTDLYFPSRIESKEIDAAMDPRREKSLLRVIRALDAMNKLPARGAAGSILLQLEQLGFSGPDEETVRKIIKEARSLNP